MGTDFVLADFDQRVPPVFQHSTAAWLAGIGPGEDDTWLYAVDNVSDTGFDPVTGQYFINLDVGVMYPHIPSQFQGGIQFNIYYISVCSYVLVHEPPKAGSPLPFPLRSAVRKQDHGGKLLGRAVNRGAVVPFVVPCNAPPTFQATFVTGSASSAQLNTCPSQCDCCRESRCARGGRRVGAELFVRD